MQHLQFFFIFAECRQSGPTVVCRSDARDALLIFFGLVPGWRVFFPHTGGVFFPLHFTFRLRRCCWSGPLGYLPNFCLAWRHLNQASKPALGLWILALHAEHVGNLQMFDLDPLIWLRTKHIPNFLKAFGYIESSHQIVLMNSPLNGEHLPEICASGYANPSKPLDANLP